MDIKQLNKPDLACIKKIDKKNLDRKSLEQFEINTVHKVTALRIM